MMHQIVGEGFHGTVKLELRGPEHGWVLSDEQVTRYRKAACGVAGCKCGGQVRFAKGSAKVKPAYELTAKELEALPGAERVLAQKQRDLMVLVPAK